MNRPVIHILYGSQTGTAQDVSYQVGNSLKRRHFEVNITYMDNFDYMTLPTLSCVLFICSTTGQGVVPDNMKRFWQFLLRKDLPSNSLNNISISVFGLGDSGYPLYNAAARKLYQRLLQLGANILYPRGLGDDQDELGYDQALAIWLDGLLSKLLELYPLDKNLKIIPDNIPLKPPLNVEIKPLINKISNNTDKFELNAYGEGLSKYIPKLITIKKERITSINHFQNVLHIEFDISNYPELNNRKPGDIISIHPKNNKDDVLKFLKYLKIDNPNDIIYINTTANELNYLPQNGIKIFDLFTYYIDILGTPGRSFFSFLSYFALNELEKEKLLELSQAKYMNDYYKYCVKEKRSYMEVLSEFSSVDIPIEYLLYHIPRIQPRQFSIASSSLYYPNSIHITLAVLQFQTPYKRQRIGLCSQYLSSLTIGSNVYIGLKQGAFNIPNNDTIYKHSYILIGPVQV